MLSTRLCYKLVNVYNLTIVRKFGAILVINIGAIILLAACSGTPNNVDMSVAQGQCVQLNQYSPSVQAIELESFPILADNPKTAPYCISITLQNNNSGTNANPVQTASPGLIVESLPGETFPPLSMFDPAAAMIPFTLGSGTQTIGNITLFDPQNCVTINGSQANTLFPGGPGCTFYLQILSESYPPNVYPINLAYNYTNGNQNYLISVNINERSFLYGGATNGLYFVSQSSQSGASTAVWQNGVDGIPESGNVTAILSDTFGNVYVAMSNQVYIYNGVSATQLGSNFSQNVNSIAMDVNGNLYAATNGAGLFVFDKNVTPNAWVSFVDTSGNLSDTSDVIGLVGPGIVPNAPVGMQNLYATTTNGAFKCTIAESSSFSTNCAFSNIGSGGPTFFNLNALAMDTVGNLYTGSESSGYAYSLANNTWSGYKFNNESGITGNVVGVNYPTVPLTPVYFSEINAESIAIESAVYTCTNGECLALISSTKNIITGNANTITTDGSGDVYVAGSELNSLDFGTSITNTSGAYLYVGPATNVWQPINNGNLNIGNIQSLVVSSILTTY